VSVPYRAIRRQRAARLSDIENALEEMKQSLELTQNERSQASYYQNLVREKLEQTLGGFQTSFLTGSYARHTAIAPLKDIDIFVVIDRARRRDLVEGEPQRCINAVRAAAANAMDRMQKSPIAQRRSIGLDFVSADLKIEVVPAFQTCQAEVFQIADRSSSRWILTSPRGHEYLSTVANKNSGEFLKPAIKMIKAWKNQNRLPIKSFHLEVMCYGALPTVPRSLSEAVWLTFEHLAHSIQMRCPDPARIGDDIDIDMDDLDRACVTEEFERCAKLAGDALRYEVSNPVWAHNRWKRIFGELYPREDRG
jgi:hypothetical protein